MEVQVSLRQPGSRRPQCQVRPPVVQAFLRQQGRGRPLLEAEVDQTGVLTRLEWEDQHGVVQGRPPKVRHLQLPSGAVQQGGVASEFSLELNLAKGKTEVMKSWIADLATDEDGSAVQHGGVEYPQHAARLWAKEEMCRSNWACQVEGHYGTELWFHKKLSVPEVREAVRQEWDRTIPEWWPAEQGEAFHRAMGLAAASTFWSKGACVRQHQQQQFDSSSARRAAAARMQTQQHRGECCRVQQKQQQQQLTSSHARRVTAARQPLHPTRLASELPPESTAEASVSQLVPRSRAASASVAQLMPLASQRQREVAQSRRGSSSRSRRTSR